MYLARTLTNASFPEIGDRFHRDHSTVMSSCGKIEHELPLDPQLKKEVGEARSTSPTSGRGRLQGGQRPGTISAKLQWKR